MKIIQLLPTISYGDAVGNDALALRGILRQWDPDTAIYAENIDPRLPKDTAFKVEQMPELGPGDVLVYHASTGTELNFRLPEIGGRKIMIYHNITPPHFFTPYSTQAANLTREGLRGARYLADKADYCIAVSEFNKKDLLRMGYTCPIDVCPILIPFADYDRPVDEKTLHDYTCDGLTNWLFVGRIAPNKKQENVIRAFYIYHKYLNPRSRLILAGNWTGMERYYQRLATYTARLGLEQDVVFTGHIKFEALLACYRAASVFVCMSEHEGFCVPLLEAMHFGVPIVALKSAAVPDTLGDSGIQLETAEPVTVAAHVHAVLENAALREQVVEQQRQRLQTYRSDTVAQRFEALFTGFLEKTPSRQPRVAQLTATITHGDAVSNDILAFQEALVSMGYPAPIYSERDPGPGWEFVRTGDEIEALTARDIALYHHATDTEYAKRFAALPGKRVMVYHNVTPPHFFAPYDRGAEQSCRAGLARLDDMRGKVDRCIADSEFNKKELRHKGYTCPIDVCPILIPFKDYEQTPDAGVMRRCGDGATNVIFVGRVAPNKKLEDVISVFAAYKKLDPAARLTLVGSYGSEDAPYYTSLRHHVQALGVQDVTFTGHISFAAILAYYRTASVFVCMSEHEGFCVPLVEAMYFDVPIVAYASTAVPETLGGSGVLVDTKDTAAAADAMYRLVHDGDYREQILRGQRERLQYFSYRNTRDILEKVIRSLMGE